MWGGGNDLSVLLCYERLRGHSLTNCQLFVQEYCPCGSQCSNTQFSRRQYADIEQVDLSNKLCTVAHAFLCQMLCAFPCWVLSPGIMRQVFGIAVVWTKAECVLWLQRRAGPKGFGLFTNQALKEGQFIIEYVGEVSYETPLYRPQDAYGRGLGGCSSVAITTSKGP